MFCFEVTNNLESGRTYLCRKERKIKGGRLCCFLTQQLLAESLGSGCELSPQMRPGSSVFLGAPWCGTSHPPRSPVCHQPVVPHPQPAPQPWPWGWSCGELCCSLAFVSWWFLVIILLTEKVPSDNLLWMLCQCDYFNTAALPVCFAGTFTY